MIIKISGGLGNQMFQYALYKKMKSLGKNVYLDISFYNKNSDHNGYELDKIFHIENNYALDIPKYIAKNDIFHRVVRLLHKIDKKYYVQKYKNTSTLYDPSIFKLNNAYLAGYWNHYKYYIDILDELCDKDFCFKTELNEQNKEILNKIKGSISVSIHVRRGDYLNKKNNYFSKLNKDYYIAAIEFIKSKVETPKFFCFSDDIDYCNELLKNENVEYVDLNKKENAHIDMLLMSNCKHNIVANSTFSIWGALLNKNNPIVVAPKNYYNDKSYCFDSWMPSWVLIENEE